GLVSWQWREAVVARRGEAQKTRAAEDAEAAERIARLRAENEAYLGSIAQAHRDWQAGNSAAAAELLDGCPAHLRHWEWHFLKSQVESPRLVVRPHDRSKVEIAYRPDNGWLITAGGGTVRAADGATG